ncbi:hypothetical protein PIROE2DRAFT_57312 [Piromyces sp. E2]|nr:hypothetical protein PIROE2DRAFT_57312 [Piromyces sp. E2]|eukprot:OUM69581.1 hypothetical protein PIROE2DRAFT_57312 [Piromyces sp. E2]
MNMNETDNASELAQNSVSPSDTDNASTTLNPVINNKIDAENLKDSQDKLSDINSPSESETSPKTIRIPLTIRCPFTTTDLNIHIDPSSSVTHLKRKIYKEFPSNPKPSDQRLIFGGRIIQNHEILSDILKRQMCDLSTPPTIHLIINSLALQHAQTVKHPASHPNSENVSANNSASASAQVSPAQSKQDLNETASASNLSSTNVPESSKVKEEDPVPSVSTETKSPLTESKPYSDETTNLTPEVSTNPYTTTSTPSAQIQSDVIQYVLIK